MFATRLIRESDALLMLEVFAVLVRRYGLPKRPIVPSPIKCEPGIDALSFDSARDANVFDWAKASLSVILQATDTASENLILIGNREAKPSQPDLISFNPQRAGECGHFTAQIVLELAEKKLGGFEVDYALNGYQEALIRLAACAFLRQGFVLTRCLPAVQASLEPYKPSQRFIESALVASACMALTLQRQTPEQILATYGTLMSRSVRRKIRPACRQLDDFRPELKLLQLLPEALSTTELDASDAVLTRMASQPQRIS